MIKIYKYGEVDKGEIFARNEPTRDVSGTVAQIISEVLHRGDRALYEYALKFDKVKLGSLEVTPEEMKEALSKADGRLMKVMKQAAKNIREFHSRQKRDGFEIKRSDGAVVGQKLTPLERVGLYVPGGTAAYPSTMLMTAIPAAIAGCKEIIVTTPPGPDGKINPAILVAAYVAGVTRIYKIGGAQAVAALAYGTESVLKVDKIVGPGNAYVAEAKRRVFGAVNIDMIAGPSEILVIADGTCNPKFVAADMLSQAEHDERASAVLVTDSTGLATAVRDELERQIPLLSRAAIARKSVDSNGKIIVVDDISVAIEVANEIAPEHLELCLDNPFDYLAAVKNAGSVFLGKNCPEAVGDYFAGPNHTLPTSGTARFSSALSVDDFVKKTQYIYYPEDAFASIADSVAYFADCEGLGAHAESVRVRKESR